MKGLIFNIQRYSIHDGSGIRTLVFFKGCPLKCPWCANPESQTLEPEQAIIVDRCIDCRQCSFNEADCPTGAWTTFGKYMSVEEVIEEVEKDYMFFRTSGGGVTLSGGEVLAQWPFAVELLKGLKKRGIHTAIETSGQGPTKGLEQMVPYLDTVLFDFKIWDVNRAKEMLHANVPLIQRNFELLIARGMHVIPRFPLIPGYTMDSTNVSAISAYLSQFSLPEVHLLPFHQYGRRKYEYLDREYELKEVEPPTDEEVCRIQQTMNQHEFDVVVGGL